MKRKDTRQRLIDAGLKLFSERGYLGAVTKDIAKEAGIAEVTLFRYFPSKESLLEEVIKTYSFLPALKGLLREIDALPYKDALTKIAERFLSTLSERKELIRIMHSEIPKYPSKTRQIYHGLINETFTTLASYFSEQEKKGVLRRFEPRYGARAFLGMFFSLFTSQELMLRKKLSKQESKKIIAELVEIFAKGTLK
ncbi:MAG: TetR/AcrR family transcriptional regulator [Nitrospirae bacterium]|nr:TetR/AcrR family transcriptional regulator [Nitrospirota bacterium]